MSGEREWVETVRADIIKAVSDHGLIVETQKRLPYANYVMGYSHEIQTTPRAAKTESPGYVTDLLLSELLPGDNGWVPRVVVEFKFGSVSSHDALTYSAKAAAHKSIHPYLRYGIVIGDHPGAVPRRLMRHGQQFDFMMTLASERLSKTDRRDLVALLAEEVEASRTINGLMVDKSKIRLFHRKLAVR